ncbi:hypothetical protein MNBD_GAMMA18-2305 [hydrothermal vent metagenome]|uniref:Outer membrane protein beta-barrel domain-containing protein n=1 Tax=hydrothermal vent metagenome TaxID=652676 RepID=A0A3B0ZR24_9ZZZZ
MKKLTINFIVAFIVLVMFEKVTAGDIKVRAREHFDFHNVSLNNSDDTSYRGLSNTINVWWEKPRIYSIGLAFNPIIGSASANGDYDARISNKIKLITLGMEGKYYHRDIAPSLFSRLGLGYSRLNTNGSIGDIDGYHVYVGAGWEFDVKGIGIALEMAFRQSRLEQGGIVNSITPSIGVHFYR